MNLLPSLFSSRNRAETGQPWQWASCKHPRTLSFRTGDDSGDGMFKTINSVFFDPKMDGFGFDHSPEVSRFTSTSESASHSTESEDLVDQSLEVLVRSVRSDRLFFEPHGDTSSILEPESIALFPPLKESVVLALESVNPYMDFRRSMEEMVESNGIKDWECLEELLAWYLKMNRKDNHGIILEAFVDVLLDLSSSSSSNNNKDHKDFNKNIDVTSFSSAASSFSDDSDTSLKGEDVAEIDDEDKMTMVAAS